LKPEKGLDARQEHTTFLDEVIHGFGKRQFLPGFVMGSFLIHFVSGLKSPTENNSVGK
jgi:hypothetical protein